MKRLRNPPNIRLLLQNRLDRAFPSFFVHCLKLAIRHMAILLRFPTNAGDRFRIADCTGAVPKTRGVSFKAVRGFESSLRDYSCIEIGYASPQERIRRLFFALFPIDDAHRVGPVTLVRNVASYFDAHWISRQPRGNYCVASFMHKPSCQGHVAYVDIWRTHEL
jgi:hypothetical protein